MDAYRLLLVFVEALITGAVSGISNLLSNRRRAWALDMSRVINGARAADFEESDCDWRLNWRLYSEESEADSRPTVGALTALLAPKTA